MTAPDIDYAAAERRIEYWTLGLGAAAALVTALRWGWRAALGVAIGAVLGWVNYRWLRQGVATLARLATVQAGAPAPRVPKRVYLKFFGRYVLLIGIVYVILSRSWLPAMAVLAGFSTLIAAVVLEVLFQLFRRGNPGAA